ncbi:MAG TPA: CHASE domain-containing protein [Thermoanaerobaculia bacterium]|nr:CHASE domain-containing protein [Thermoanaerobaculia bacterium]
MAPASSTRHGLAPWIVLASFLTLTALASAYVWKSSQIFERADFERERSAALDDIRFRSDTYVNVLRAAGGLFAAGQNVTRDQFRSYVQALEIPKRHPGIQGIGLSVRVRGQHLQGVVMEMRLNEFADFRVWPEEPPRDEYHTIVLLQPLDDRNRAAIGYDMSTNVTRYQAMTRARDTGEAAATAPVRLVQEIDPGEEQRGFLIYVPVYTARGTPATVEERRDKLYGYVYAPFRANDLFNAIFASQSRDVAFSIFDGNNPFYVSSPAPSESPRYESASTIEVGGREWTVRIASRRIAGANPVIFTLSTAVGGVIISLLLFALLRMQLRGRARAEQIADTLRQSEAELQAANRAKDEFLATLSHELRTPMTAIMGWSKLLGEELDEDTRAVAVDAIQKSSAAQAQLIEDLLDVSRITAGKMKIEPAPLELAPIVDLAVAAVAPAAEAKGIDVRLQLPETPLIVCGDPARLQQIIWNLVSNAVKFTPSGGTVDLRLRAEGEEAVVDVIDSGEGIDPAFLPHVFERFRQADSSTTRAYTGLGLGLAIVRHLVELHGGSVAAHSDGDQEGSTFTVRLPVMRTEVPVHQADEPRDAQLSGMLDGIRILVVDDEPDVRRYALAVFRMSGADGRGAASTEEALRVFEEWPADVVVTDIGMPQRDGFELLREIRERSDVPIVALTAYARVEDRERAAEAGFDAFVSKPVDPGSLRATIASVLTRSERAEKVV